ncbi:MAG: asparagine synthase (glutamine-hydrolyzing) [Proteobacteria bacterium]|nr:asparagine synthase (glutamine-hydrolyzing) [Pseudomonadota bacterium]MBU4259778.1 asparagine synthase (glutamine-hydrolyzing) [Pseudomonadota bacterium]MBU4287543.1 asparagine synthase (glutamine-hydrolyzing) [Pseudomonadota bacterium]MBU4414584.1 asparagine synthase (glutamine-hydrolyzing) [Pseudomonadota bacterium]MCG2759148.1 asparagine synthase (glutamine-hydrolyzing) [Desulfobacteraceae bacterium]
MCGICGIYNEKNLSAVTDMLESIRHRGPDFFATMLFGNHSLGECWLNIVSNKDDILPLVDGENKIALLFNGEIYNYQEIKRDLTKDGYIFSSNTDSEIIIPLYKKYKNDFAKHLKGMFAIAIIDQDQILLARDKFGIKPLYYHQVKNKLIFGSEIKSLLQYPGVPAELDRESLEESMVFGYIFSEKRTLLKEIYQVPPGSLIAFDGNSISKQRYYQMPASFYLNNGNIDYEESVSQLTTTLLKTFELLHKHGNSEKGIYLSGGVDSTLMAVLSREILEGPVHTYTLYDSEDAQDFNYARKVAKAIGSDHHELFVTPSDYLNELPSFIYHYENLIAGGVFDIQGGTAFQILSKYISRHHKVAFTGEGADELFGGYYWIYTHPLGFSDRIRERASLLPTQSKARELVENIFPYPEDERVYRKNLFDILMKSGLSNYHLWSVDRSCSSFGFETRPPYLYDDIAEFALSLPIDFKVPNKSMTKMILKDAALPYLKKYNLADIVNRKKYGMPAALEHITPQIRSILHSFIPDEIINRHPFKQYFKTALDVMMFDLFYYFIIHKRGKFESDFSLYEFYKGRINEGMYNQQISSHPGGNFCQNLLVGTGSC